VDRDERVKPRATTPPDQHILVIEVFRIAVGCVRCRRWDRGHCAGGGDAAGAGLVDDPVPVVVPVDELPVDVLDGGVGGVVAVEFSGVVEVESPGVSVDPVDVAPLDVGVCVAVVEDPPAVFEVLLSEGAFGLTPPPLSAVEVPPVGRGLTLTVVVAVS
jgi:hypothetical protein